MGSFINRDNEKLRISRRSKIYVDKSLLITALNDVIGSEERFLCISRPRRFGKSMAANMISAYYDESCDSRPLFEDLKIAKEPSFETHLNKYPVIKLDIPTVFSDMDKTKPFEVAFNECILKDIYKYYPTVEKENFSSVAEAIFYLYEQNKKQFVFIIDEWDAIFREYLKDIEDQKSYIQFLRDLFKSNASNSIALCYMTGILPIKKYNTESALNNFR